MEMATDVETAIKAIVFAIFLSVIAAVYLYSQPHIQNILNSVGNIKLPWDGGDNIVIWLEFLVIFIFLYPLIALLAKALEEFQI